MTLICCSSAVIYFASLYYKFLFLDYNNNLFAILTYMLHDVHATLY